MNSLTFRQSLTNPPMKLTVALAHQLIGSTLGTGDLPAGSHP